MRRREFITLLGGAAVGWPLRANAQQREPVRRIGVLMNLAADDPEGQAPRRGISTGTAGSRLGRGPQCTNPHPVGNE